MDTTKKYQIENILAGSGITINGTDPWDIRVSNDRFYARVLSQGSLGLGESYMAGWWECDNIDELVTRLMRHQIHKKLKPSLGLAWNIAMAKFMNLQAKSRAFHIGKAHYDTGNDLYSRMLDKRMVYTCGYWKDAVDLDQTQEAKLDLVCRKIGLKPGQKVLDIGCGWGSFAKFAAEKYGAEVVGITVSQEQVKLGREMCAGLPIELRYQDYREINEKFDHIISLGMFEHVGVKNYRTYFEVVHRCLKDDGLFLLHTIGSNKSTFSTDPWITKYIFPNSMLPSAVQISKAAEGLMVMEDWHNFSADYDKTLMAWYHNFETSWDGIKDDYDERFHRMWRFYLLACAGTFRSRQNQLWQIVYSKYGVDGGYTSLR